MQFNIFLEDLNEDAIARIKQTLKQDLKEEIEEAVKNGMDRETAEIEIVNDYLNRHDLGIPAEL